MEDQSAEATLRYIIDAGLDTAELMGGPAESFAGMPDTTVNCRAFFGLMRKQRNGSLTEDEEKEMKEMQAALYPYSNEVAEWRAKADMEPFWKLRDCFDFGVCFYVGGFLLQNTY